MISDTPGVWTRGVKKGKIFVDVIYGWPPIQDLNLLVSIVHMDKTWVKIAKNFEMWTSVGRGGPGGSKKGKFLKTSFMDGPLELSCLNLLRDHPLKDARTQGGGGGGSQKRTHVDAGGQWQKGLSSNTNFYQNFLSLHSILCARVSMTNH